MASVLRQRIKTLRTRRVFKEDQLEDTELRRCLNLWDLTALGLGSTLGVGVHVLVGSVALHLAGPSVVLSFLIAAVAALFAGLCYAEFGVRVPRAGAAYIYAYATDGELIAFLVGWINIFEYIFGAASVARGLSSYVDWAAGGSMSAWFNSTMAINAGSPMSPHFDLLAFLLVLTVGAALAIGTRESMMVNNVVTAVNIATILFIIIAGSLAANSNNWSIPVDNVPPLFGSGGFFPYGISGTIQGAAICFYGFVGFDSISAAAEEVKSPRRTLPIAIILVLVVASIAYCCVAVVVTMMAPYFELDTVAAVFSLVGWDWAKWIVTFGAIFGITASLFGALFPLPRLLYAMASDGLFFTVFNQVHSWRQVPLVATIVPTVIIAILASILELNQLVMMMCTGTLVSYTVVAACVIVLRYRSSNVSEGEQPSKIKQMVGLGEKSPSKTTTSIVVAILFLYLIACVSSGLVMRYARILTVPIVIVSVLLALLIIIMALQPRVTPDLIFKTPLVPVLPCLSIYVNIHLMIFIGADTWIRVAVWMLIGILFYIMFACCCRTKKKDNLEENLKFSHSNKNGKAPVEIVVELPTPPDTMNGTSNNGGGRSVPPIENNDEILEMQEVNFTSEIMPYEPEEITVQHAVVENNEEKEAKIIDLLDKVLQAEEDAYGEIISLKEPVEDNDAVSENVIHRKSFSELSETGSDLSLGNQELSKYDVIAQVHREDLPKVTEEQLNKGEADILDNNENEEQELATNLNDSDSRTDESGYSDTLDKPAPNDSTEDVKDTPYIPPPPPFNAEFFATTNFKKSYTVPSRPARRRSVEEQEENKPRESIKSNASQQGDGNIIFGSDRQANFMSKLNVIMQKRIDTDKDDEDHRKRSNSTGNVAEAELSIKRPILPYLQDLIKETKSKEASQNLKPVPIKVEKPPEVSVENKSDDEEDISMTRDAFRSKLENMYKNGGPQMVKPKIKSQPLTPEEEKPDHSSSESLSQLPKMEKNDTIKRQKDKFSQVLNSFRLSFNKDDDV